MKLKTGDRVKPYPIFGITGEGTVINTYTELYKGQKKSVARVKWDNFNLPTDYYYGDLMLAQRRSHPRTDLFKSL